jgi:hypothetical protein
MSEGKTPPPSKLDRALARWPTRERAAREWEQSAERVIDRLKKGDAERAAGHGYAHKLRQTGRISDVSDEDLLRSPLPPVANEVQNSAARESEARAPLMSTEPREKSRSSFADLAKLAQMTPPPSGRVSTVPSSERVEREENSGVIDLAALQASGEQASGDVTSLSSPAMRAPESSHVSASSPMTEAAAPGRARAPSAWLALVGVAAVAAAAAGAFVASRHPAATQPAVAVAVTAATPASPAAAAATGPARRQSDDAVDPSKLPRALPSVATRVQPAGVAAPRPAAAPIAANVPPPAAAATPNPQAAQPAVAAAAVPAAQAGGDNKNLETLMREATGTPAGGAAQPVTAQGVGAGANGESVSEPGDRGSVPLRPSLGAINGAIGTAMPAARACLDVDAPVSRASITFNSDGSVGAVAISGWAAGKPAEACIRAALSKARVPPFAQPTYTVPATIRSN